MALNDNLKKLKEEEDKTVVSEAVKNAWQKGRAAEQALIERDKQFQQSVFNQPFGQYLDERIGSEPVQEIQVDTPIEAQPTSDEDFQYQPQGEPVDWKNNPQSAAPVQDPNASVMSSQQREQQALAQGQTVPNTSDFLDSFDVQPQAQATPEQDYEAFIQNQVEEHGLSRQQAEYNWRQVSQRPAQPASPYNSVQNQLELENGLHLGYLSNVATLESGGRPDARNPNSSAVGLYQFMPGTAAEYGYSEEDLLNPDLATDLMIKHTQKNKGVLEKALGRPVEPHELYLAHQQGATGALKLLSNPNAKAVDVVGRQQVLLNGGNDSMTAKEFSDLWMSKYNKIPREVGVPNQNELEAPELPMEDKIAQINANSDGGAGEAEKNGKTKDASSFMANSKNLQYDANGIAEIDAGVLGLDFGTGFVHRNREVSDSEALWQGLLAGGIAVLGTALAGGDSKDLGAAFFIAGANRFGNALNQSHRYKNIDALTKMGYTPDSIEQYVEQGDRSVLKKHDVPKWEEWPDGSGRQYRQLPNGKVQVMRGNPKYEDLKMVDDNGDEYTYKWNPAMGFMPETDADGKPKLDDKGNPVPFKYKSKLNPNKTKATTATGSVQRFVDPTGKMPDKYVIRRGNEFVDFNKMDERVDLTGYIPYKAPPKASKSSDIDPNSAEGKAVLRAQNTMRKTQMNNIDLLSRAPLLEHMSGWTGVGLGTLLGKTPEGEGVQALFTQTFNQMFLDGIPQMKGYGSLSNAEGSRIAAASTPLMRVNPETGRYEFNTSLPTDFVMAQMKQIMEVQLAMDVYAEMNARGIKEPEAGTPQGDAMQAQVAAEVERRMKSQYPKLARVSAFSWAGEKKDSDGSSDFTSGSEGTLDKLKGSAVGFYDGLMGGSNAQNTGDYRSKYNY